jgi:ferredoxin
MLRLYWFSGTGNARSAARWIVETWRARGQPAEAVELARTDPRTVRPAAGDVVGLASPTHGFNLPPLVLSFLFALPRTPHRNRAFVVTTRAGVRVLGVGLPGLSGAAQLLAALVLLLKGYSVVGLRPLDLPSNWLSLHPGLREDNVRALYARFRQTARTFAGRLLDGGRDYRALRDVAQDLAVAPLALGYYLVGRFVFAKSFVAGAACDDCGVCYAQCPVQAIERVMGRPYWTWRCESCMRCMNRCPRRAIETAHGFVVAMMFVPGLVLGHLVYPWLAAHAPAALARTLPAGAARLALESALTLALLFAAYRLLHALRGRPAVDRVVTLTSLTHYRFWRRYRPPKAF